MAANLDILDRVSTSTVSDALDRHGINGQALGLKPLDRSFRIIGRAFTLKYTSVGAVRGTVGDFIDDLGPGDVVAIDNNGRMDATIWGDILTLVASRRGVSGTIIDGICRDTDRALELKYPIFARGNAMRSGKDRVMLEATQVPGKHRRRPRLPRRRRLRRRRRRGHRAQGTRRRCAESGGGNRSGGGPHPPVGHVRHAAGRGAEKERLLRSAEAG